MEPSAISSLSVEGSTPGSRTVRDSVPKRGWFGLGEWNRPRNRPVVWKVDIAEEAAFAMGLCGSLLWSLSGYVNDGTAAGIKHEATEKLYERHYLVIKIVSSFFDCLLKFFYL